MGSPRDTAGADFFSLATREVLFHGTDLERARELLVNECGNNLRFLEEYGPERLERFRFAALKLSDGRLDKLRDAVQLAKADWRDLLVAASFGDDVHGHEKWMPQ